MVTYPYVLSYLSDLMYNSVSKYFKLSINCPKIRKHENYTIPPLFHVIIPTYIVDNFLNDNIQEDFVLLREQVVESEIEDGSDIELDDLLVAI